MQQYEVPVKKEILTDQIERIMLSSEYDEFERERQLLSLMYDSFAGHFCEWLSNYDRKQSSQMRAQGYVEEKEVARQVTFLFGTIPFSRKCWKRDKDIVYPVDELLKIDRYARHSKTVFVTLARMAEHASYRAAATITSLIAPLHISKDTVLTAVHTVGETIKNCEAYELEHAYAEPGTKEVDVLVEEADGIIIPFNKRKKGRELLHVLIHEKKRKDLAKEGESVLTAVKEFVGFNKREVKKLVQAYLYSTYNLKNTVVVSNSDNGPGVKEEFFKELSVGAKAHFHVLDEYHWHLKLTQRMSFCEELIPIMKRAIYNYSMEDVGVVITTMESLAEDSSQRKHTKKLEKYLVRNWAYLEPINWRLKSADLAIKKKHLGLGAIESTHKKITYRQKHRGMHWGMGAEYLAKIIICDREGSLEEICGKFWRFIREEKELSTDYLVVTDEDNQGAIKEKYAGKTYKVALDRESELERQQLARLFRKSYPHL